MSVRLVLDIKSNQYKITKFSETHNYTDSSREFKSRLLATNEKEDIEVFLDLCVHTKSVKSFVREKEAKPFKRRIQIISKCRL